MVSLKAAFVNSGRYPKKEIRNRSEWIVSKLQRLVKKNTEKVEHILAVEYRMSKLRPFKFTTSEQSGVYILENTHPPGGNCQPVSFGGKNMKMRREKGGKCK
jgi:hypothetical protein